MELYREAAEACFFGKYKRGCLEALKEMIELAMFAHDIYFLKRFYFILGLILMSFKDIRAAGTAFKRLRDVATVDQDFEVKMYAYKQLGICYQNVKEYEKSIVCFKKLLHLAWLMENIEYEMMSYDYLAIQYFYIGRLDRSKFYNDRMVRGKSESKASSIRNFGMKNFSEEAAFIREA